MSSPCPGYSTPSKPLHKYVIVRDMDPEMVDAGYSAYDTKEADGFLYLVLLPAKS
ncbi:MAG: hypothetical protein IH860_04960 [Chloroflexi bacterium]|nr:hypothetical protein [Chloroflexota bacterium]